MSMLEKLNTNDAQKVVNVPKYDAHALTQNGVLANIVLDEKCYTLRITRQGKLILTK